MDGSNRPTKFKSVNCPCEFRNAPTKRAAEGKNMNKNANKKNGTTPSQLRQPERAGRAFGASRLSFNCRELGLFDIGADDGHPLIANDFYSSRNLIDGRKGNLQISSREVCSEVCWNNIAGVHIC